MNYKNLTRLLFACLILLTELSVAKADPEIRGSPLVAATTIALKDHKAAIVVTDDIRIYSDLNTEQPLPLDKDALHYGDRVTLLDKRDGMHGVRGLIAIFKRGATWERVRLLGWIDYGDLLDMDKRQVNMNVLSARQELLVGYDDPKTGEHHARLLPPGTLASWVEKFLPIAPTRGFAARAAQGRHASAA